VCARAHTFYVKKFYINQIILDSY